MFYDKLSLEDRSGKRMLKVLQSLKEGESLESKFFPALSDNLQWVCVKAEKDIWRFAGMFCGILFKTVEVTHTEVSLWVQEV